MPPTDLCVEFWSLGDSTILRGSRKFGRRGQAKGSKQGNLTWKVNHGFGSLPLSLLHSSYDVNYASASLPYRQTDFSETMSPNLSFFPP